jgi:hypothetical protein
LTFESTAGARTRRHKEWRGLRFDPLYGPVYGAPKLAKAKLPLLTEVLDIYAL